MAKKYISGFEQFLNECGCAGNGHLPEAGDIGLGQDGTSIKNETDSMVMEDDEETGEYHEGQKTITISAFDSYGELEKLLNAIKAIGGGGHSFDIVLDPGSDDEQTFHWDGDGSDQIQSIESQPEEEDEESEPADYGTEEEEGEGNEDSETEPEEDEDEEVEEGYVTESKKEEILRKIKKYEQSKRLLKAKPGTKEAIAARDKKQKELTNQIKKLRDELKSVNESKKRPGSEADGSYPITDLASLKKAIHAYGRSSNKEKTKAHIKSRAKALGLTKHVSDEWK